MVSRIAGLRLIFLSLGNRIMRNRAKRCCMKSKVVNGFGLMIGLLVVCIPMFAHHGGSDYDIQHPVTLKGTVTEFYWSNPHCQVFLDARDDSSKVVNWTIETLAPAVLRRAGWSPKTLHPGDQISITVVPSKKGTPVGMLRKVVLPDGTELTGGALGEQPQQ
jgi:hypothetical protein